MGAGIQQRAKRPDSLGKAGAMEEGRKEPVLSLLPPQFFRPLWLGLGPLLSCLWGLMIGTRQEGQEGLPGILLGVEEEM